jgi:hypothetical protein
MRQRLGFIAVRLLTLIFAIGALFLGVTELRAGSGWYSCCITHWCGSDQYQLCIQCRTGEGCHLTGSCEGNDLSIACGQPPP